MNKEPNQTIKGFGLRIKCYYDGQATSQFIRHGFASKENALSHFEKIRGGFMQGLENNGYLSASETIILEVVDEDRKRNEVVASEVLWQEPSGPLHYNDGDVDFRVIDEFNSLVFVNASGKSKVYDYTDNFAPYELIGIYREMLDEDDEDADGKTNAFVDWLLAKEILTKEELA